MSDYSIMTNYERLSRFLIATSPDEMLQRIAQGLYRVNGNKQSFRGLDIPRVFPRDDGSFAIQYVLELQSGEGLHPEVLILCGCQARSSFEASGLVAKWGRDVILCEDINVVIPVFPFDPTLKILKELCRTETVPPLLEKWLSARIGVGEKPVDFRYEVLGYRLEKRCTLCFTVTPGGKDEGKDRVHKVIVKVSRPRKAEKLTRRLAHLRKHWNQDDRSISLTIPETYEIDVSSGLHLMEYLPGESLHDLIGEAAFGPACEAAGKLLAKLHSIPGFPGTTRTEAQEMETIGGWVDVACPLEKDCYERFEQAQSRLRARMSAPDGHHGETCLHGDFYDKQVIYSSGRSSLLDFDSLTSGDPAADIGNFLAHLVLRNLQHPGHVQQIEGGRRVFMESYGNGDESFKQRIHWWKAASLVRLAAVYCLRPRWRYLTPMLLDETSRDTDSIT